MSVFYKFYFNLLSFTFKYIIFTIGSVAYYFYLGAFFWLNIICFDIWASFTHPFTAAQRYSKRKNFRNYSLYAWGLPMLMTVVTMTLQLSSINTSYKSGIGESHCWLKSKTIHNEILRDYFYFYFLMTSSR